MERIKQAITLDIVIPVHNEEKVLDLLFQKLQVVFSSETQRKHGLKSVRYLLIDDGSKDQSANIVCRHIASGIPATLYRLSRRFGHQNAVSAGFEKSNADVIACIDADLQDPPEVILEMIAKWRQGYDVVYGQRQKRKENFIKVAGYWLFYRLLAYLSEIDIPLDSGDFSLMDRKVAQALCALPERIRFPRVLRAWIGFKQIGVSYERGMRAAGTPKYTLASLYRLATDGVASASIRPLQMSQVFSFCYLLLVITLVTAFTLKLKPYLEAKNEMALWFLFSYVLIAMGSFVQIFCTYIMSAYLGRAYIEIKGRPSYLIMEEINKDNVHIQSLADGKREFATK